MSKTFTRKKGAIGIPKTIKLEYYPDVTPFFVNIDNNLTPVPQPSEELIEEHLDGMISEMESMNVKDININ